MKKYLILIVLFSSGVSLHGMRRVVPRILSTTVRLTICPTGNYCTARYYSPSIYPTLTSREKSLIVDTKEKSIKYLEKRFTPLYIYKDMPLLQACFDMQKLHKKLSNQQKKLNASHMPGIQMAQVLKEYTEKSQALQQWCNNLEESIVMIKSDPRWLKFLEIKALNEANKEQKKYHKNARTLELQFKKPIQ